MVMHAPIQAVKGWLSGTLARTAKEIEHSNKVTAASWSLAHWGRKLEVVAISISSWIHFLNLMSLDVDAFDD